MAIWQECQFSELRQIMRGYLLSMRQVPLCGGWMRRVFVNSLHCAGDWIRWPWRSLSLLCFCDHYNSYCCCWLSQCQVFIHGVYPVWGSEGKYSKTDPEMFFYLDDSSAWNAIWKNVKSYSLCWVGITLTK